MDDAILQRWQIAPADTVPNVKVRGDWIITQKAPVDGHYDQCTVIGPDGYGSTDFRSALTEQELSSVVKVLEPVRQAYADANGGKQPSEPSQVIPYFSTPEL